MNELYINAKLYLDTDKKKIEDALHEFWDKLEGLNPDIEMEIDEYVLRDEEYNVIDK